MSSLKVWRVPSCCSLSTSSHPSQLCHQVPSPNIPGQRGKAAPGLEELKAAPAAWQQLTKSSFMCDERVRLEREVSCSIPMTPAGRDRR